MTLLISCDNFVEVDLPGSQLNGETVFEDATTANAAMAGVYTKLRDTGLLTGRSTGLSCRLGLYSDELDYYQANDPNYFYTNSLFSAESGIQDLWNQSYNVIYSSNAVIEGVSASKSLSQNDKNHLKGEALFVRTLIHFYLLNLYGEIPYVKTTDYVQNSKVHKMPVSEVYNQIVNDLSEAVLLLPEDYISSERVRPNKAATHALLARVYLFMGLWAEAANSASAVLNNPLYTWEPDLDKIFLKGSTTTIWQFIPDSNTANSAEGNLFIFNSGPPASVALNNNLMSSFESNDQRKTHWTRAITDGNLTWYHAYKYKLDSGAGISSEYSVVFRLAEQYLIRAEARARQGDLIGAKEDLNKIRNTAGLNDTNALTSAEITTAVLNERRFEFFTEFGHRFFDLKRTGILDTTLASKPGWSHDDALWPLPAQELQANPNLNPQNSGY
ncbi:RagB/SusD family nutrient uptake outer membrane protein [Flavobacterium cupreum]|uniref:RagB/SusD family nutrient uptake outer membrane protein n=2 Tax=Flavobacterium TaxID=237 RepID=A0A4Y7UG06_9FLAO|nr:RagB/SusD family nutrient uptake outer membrane protein [Flavobacterium cupreum]TEB45403.1 RagB/SusD family nutrient uptake outer membrane protein [Flavobacterium circumlabens]